MADVFEQEIDVILARAFPEGAPTTPTVVEVRTLRDIASAGIWAGYRRAQAEVASRG